MLLTVEHFDAVAGLVIPTEGGLFLAFVKDRLAVPGSGLRIAVGSTITRFQNVDCRRVLETTATRTGTSHKLSVHLRRQHQMQR